MLKAFEDMVHKDLVGPMEDYDSRVYVALRLADVCPKMEGGTAASSSFHFGRLGVSITHSPLQGYGPQHTHIASCKRKLQCNIPIAFKYVTSMIRDLFLG